MAMRFSMLSIRFLAVVILLQSMSGCQKTAEKKVEDEAILSTLSTNIDPKKPKSYKKIVSIGIPITEIIFALEEGKRVVAFDINLPTDTTLKLPKVGYGKTLKSDFILEHSPEAVFSDVKRSPQEVVDEVKQQKIDYFLFSIVEDVPSIKKLIELIATRLDVVPKGKALAAKMDEDLAKLNQFNRSHKDSLKVLYIHARNKQSILFGGKYTPADGIIKLTASKNAGDLYDDMNRITSEAMQEMNPDVLLMSAKTIESIGTPDAQGTLQPLFESRAYQTGRIIVVNDDEVNYFGIRAPKIAYDLATKLYPKR